MTRLRLGCTLVLVFSAISCHLPSAADLQVCKHATLSARLSGPARLSHSSDLKQFTLDFGVISSARQQVVWTLENPGPLEVTVLKVVDDVDPAWNVDVQQGQSIPARGQLDLTVTFMPPSNGVFTHSLSIVTDACVLSSVGVTLKGAQVASPALLPSDTLIDFGPGPVAARSQRTRIVTLSNVSDVDLTVETTSVSGAQAQAFEAFVKGGGKSVTVGAGQTTDLNIRFSPGTDPSSLSQHFEAYLTVSYCLEGCTTVLTLQADSYECLAVQTPSIVFDGGSGQTGISFLFNSQVFNGNYLCDNPVRVGLEPAFLNQLPDGGPADGGPFSLDPWVVDGGLYVYFGGAGLGLTFAPIDNLASRGALNISYDDPMPYAMTIPLWGHASCLSITQYPYFSTYAGGLKDAVTQSFVFQNHCAATNVTLTAAPAVSNLPSDAGKAPDGPFQLAPGAVMAGTVVAPQATLDLPIVYAPTENRSLNGSYDQGELDLATDEPNDNPTSIVFFGQGYGPSIYVSDSMNFSNSLGTTTTQSVYVGNFTGDYQGHAPAILGTQTDCVGLSAGLDAGLPAPVPYGQWYFVDATWSPPVCDGGRCSCDGGSCQCSIHLLTSDVPPPQSTILVYY